jgi:hypothetical protein
VGQHKICTENTPTQRTVPVSFAYGLSQKFFGSVPDMATPAGLARVTGRPGGCFVLLFNRGVVKGD